MAPLTRMAAIAIAGLAALSGCAKQAATQYNAEQLEVLAAMDAHMRAISANDLALMATQQTPDGMTYSVFRDEAGEWKISGQTNAYWVAPERADDNAYQERYWAPTVLVRGAMALVWAPYEFKINGEASHCGVDAFSFAKVDGKWLSTNAMWTVEPSACDELRPADAAMMRPNAEK